ncbi:hypothetical protein EJ05DRAFT_65214 [Pseudovirgaria hyperparasitica]|uniref:Uncharacterized protein n=1 Tax=Pseudovirgaria hyperparasitica TaxID=470096 RepID=A0A6A6W5W9_9PEZI|nr:uncharacterized protein EJ05DRAFT_65214 [Pseudovirgaria hyperparasitica]KAF2756451.1 hypothetical protein EJ05DRAFT_65214 [Pseudovirgaria hyperparasitica]
MSSPPQSPTTSHRRNPSNISTSAQNARRRSYQHSRQSSSYQDFSPIGSPTQPQFDGEHDVPAAGSGNGLGSLADELGEWDSDEDAVEDETQIASEANDSSILGADRTKGDIQGLKPGNAHRRNESLYDGSDYGDEDDLEADQNMSKGLERQIAEVESLARRGLEENGSANDGVVSRVTASLRDLGSQAGVESI